MHSGLFLYCFGLYVLEVHARRVWCVGGPDMPIEEVAFQLGIEVATLKVLLNHIPNLSYYAIRNAGMDFLSRTNSSAGMKIGFLADGDASEILDKDRHERERLADERDDLFNWYLRKLI